MFKNKIKIAIIAGLGLMFLCLVCGIIGTFLPPGEEASAPAEIATQVQMPEDTPLPTKTPEPTRTPNPTATVFITSTPSVANNIYDELIFTLNKETILDVKITGRDLVIQTNLDRSNAKWFFDDIGSIHGIVVRENPDVDRMIINDVFDQQIIMSMDAMKSYYNHSIDWETFRSTWTVINPEEN